MDIQGLRHITTAPMKPCGVAAVAASDQTVNRAASPAARYLVVHRGEKAKTTSQAVSHGPQI